jgi:hypothetical protein
VERAAPPGGTVFGLVLGFAAGVLATALVLPDHSGGTTAALSTTPQAAAGQQAVADAPTTAEQGTVPTDGSTVTGPPVAGGQPQAVVAAPGAVSTSSPGRAAAGSTRPKTTATTKGGPVRGGAAATGTGGVATGSAQGVTNDSIKIGLAYPDLTALRTLGAEYDNGDVCGQWDALRKGMIEKKQLPVAGRSITFVCKSFNVLDTNDQNAACRALVEDDKVFAVIGVAYFEVGDSCVAGLKIPVITTDGPNDAAFKASAPYLYSLSVSDSKMLRNMVHWADQRGALKGKRIGVYYANDAVNTSEAQTQVIGELKKLGHQVVAEHSTGQTLGGPEDAIAAQKFMASQVDIAILLTSEGGFQQQAQALGYKPTYLDSDHAFGTSDVATSTYPADQFDGTYGITGRNVGEAAAGMPPRADAEACIANYEKQSGTTVARPGKGGHQGAVFAYVLNSCDLGKVVLHALGQAGRGLNVSSYLAGLRTISSMTLTNYSPVTFTSRPDGGTQQRTVRWTKSCTCWQAIGGFAPFPAP